jgi:pimeloyl-ACP methyl ester carboxylesterase
MCPPTRFFLIVGLLIAIATDPAEAQDPPSPTAGQIVHVNGIEMHYEEQGAGEPLVVLHGFFGCGQIWQPIADSLAAHHRLIIPDLRGHGRSTNPAGSFTHRQSASDVLTLLDSLGVERFRGIGFSSGGMTLLHAATRAPERVETMVLIGATSYFPEATRAIQRDMSFEGLPAPALEEFRRCASRGDVQVRRLLAQFKAFADSYDDMNFTPPYLSTVSARTLIVHGDRDPFFPVEIPVGLYRAIPEAALWIVPGGGHTAIFEPSPMFATVVLDFLASGAGQ